MALSDKGIEMFYPPEGKFDISFQMALGKSLLNRKKWMFIFETCHPDEYR